MLIEKPEPHWASHKSGFAERGRAGVAVEEGARCEQRARGPRPQQAGPRARTARRPGTRRTTDAASPHTMHQSWGMSRHDETTSHSSPHSAFALPSARLPTPSSKPPRAHYTPHTPPPPPSSHDDTAHGGAVGRATRLERRRFALGLHVSHGRLGRRLVEGEEVGVDTDGYARERDAAPVLRRRDVFLDGGDHEDDDLHAIGADGGGERGGGADKVVVGEVEAKGHAGAAEDDEDALHRGVRLEIVDRAGALVRRDEPDDDHHAEGEGAVVE
mmetsp:Transcript_76376/g.202927  ORF Transcript_76376/g.202927 Transcript_76376/m.202927 type:complete len:272 (-) Transcript_76376:307-1122(-)